MINERDPLVKRIWASQPTKRGRWERWTVREVANMDISEKPVQPFEKLGYRKQQYELYYHSSVVDELRKENARLAEELLSLHEDAAGASI